MHAARTGRVFTPRVARAMRRGSGATLSGLVLASCLTPDAGGAEADAGATPGREDMTGCPAGQTCWVVLAAQTLDDRVEVFGGPAGTTPSYRGALDVDLDPGTQTGTLDEPFGMALSSTGLHVVMGHYPARERGAMLSFPNAFFDERDTSLIPADTFFVDGVFGDGVIETPIDELEPIFALDRPKSGKILVSVFANELFAPEQIWINPGKLAIVDAADPSDFALATLTGLDGGDCLGASQMAFVGDEQTVAVACDGNEAVAFVDLGDLARPTSEVADGISGTVCPLPFPNDRRSRYLAHDGQGGVLIGVGPTPLNDAASQVFAVAADCGLSSIHVADNDGQLGELVEFGPQHWLLAQGARASSGERGVLVISPTGICQTLPGLENQWETAGEPLSPYALAVAPDRTHLVIGAASTTSAGDEARYGKVLWVTLEGASDPCTMSGEVTDLTDGAAGHAPAPTLADTTTWRRAPHVVVIAQVQGT